METNTTPLYHDNPHWAASSVRDLQSFFFVTSKVGTVCFEMVSHLGTTLLAIFQKKNHLIHFIWFAHKMCFLIGCDGLCANWAGALPSLVAFYCRTIEFRFFFWKRGNEFLFQETRHTPHTTSTPKVLCIQIHEIMFSLCVILNNHTIF